jgi:hypothetical protein
MTSQRRDEHSTEFGLWLREQPTLDSGLGYVATNIDYVWRNYKTGQWMLIEEKRHGAISPKYQRDIFRLLDFALIDQPDYRGFHIIVFENTSPDDGKTWIDGCEVSTQDLLRFLRFETPAPTCRPINPTWRIDTVRYV